MGREIQKFDENDNLIVEIHKDGLQINVATEEKQNEILNKMPVLEPDGGVPVVIQDDLTALTGFHVIVQGHVVME